MRAAEAGDAVDGDRHRERPSGGDDDPSGVVTLAALEHDVRDDTVTEDDQDRGAEHLCEKGGHVRLLEGEGGRRGILARPRSFG